MTTRRLDEHSILTDALTFAVAAFTLYLAPHAVVALLGLRGAGVRVDAAVCDALDVDWGDDD